MEVVATPLRPSSLSCENSNSLLSPQPLWNKYSFPTESNRHKILQSPGCRISWTPYAFRPGGSSKRGSIHVSFNGPSEFLRGCPSSSASLLDSLKVSTYLGQSTQGWTLKVPLKSTVRSKQPNKAYVVTMRNDYPQNADFPRTYSKKEKKPFPVPIVELRRAARQRLKGRLPQRPISPARRGLTVKSLVPLAHNVLNARTTVINNLKKLLKVVPVHSCGWCDEIHVGPVGHPFKSCRGSHSSERKGLHDWSTSGTTVEDILSPIETYHLNDRLGRRISHEERFSIPRIPAVVELCIQAGVEIPEFPTKRRRKPIIRIGRKEFVDADESELPDPVPEPPLIPLLVEISDSEALAPSTEEEKILLAEETLQAWDKMRRGAKRLMQMYPVRVCGYCPEIHVGPSGHKAQNCGAHKHQQRNGQHGWQAAVLDNLIPPRYVWHVPDVNGPPLCRDLRSFYGKAPAVVEICVQAGAQVPDQYKPTMRLDVGIPSSIREAELAV